MIGPEVLENLWKLGYGRLGSVLSQADCEDLQSFYEEPDRFRSRIDMARFRFGRGEYKYFAYPLPDLVAGLRETLYRQLADCANAWMAALKLPCDYPADLSDFLKLCHERGQNRPTPLLLHYRAG